MYCLEIWGNNFNNNLQCISTLYKKAIRIANTNIFKIVNNVCMLSNTNNLFLNSNILKFNNLYKYCIHAQCKFKEMPKQNIILIS